MRKDPEFRAKVREKSKEILGTYVKKFKCLMGLGLLFNILGLVGEFVNPLFIGLVIDAIVKKDFKEVNFLTILWLVLNTAGSLFSGIQRYIFQIITERIGQELRQNLFEEVMRKDVAFFDQRKTGDIISRLTSDTAKIENALSTQVSIVIKNGLFIIIVLVMFFIISVKMTLFTLAVMLPSLFFGPVYGKFMRKINKLVSDEKASSSNIAEEAFSNIRTVKAFATEDAECILFAEKNDEVLRHAKRAARCYGWFQFGMTFIMFGSMDALIYFAAFLNSKGTLSIGDFASFQFYMFSFLLNFMTMASVIGEVMGVMGTAEGIAEIFMYEPKINIDGGEEVTQATIDDGSIELKDIQFTYPSKKEI